LLRRVKPEDLESFGLIRDFVGRLPVISPMTAMASAADAECTTAFMIPKAPHRPLRSPLLEPELSENMPSVVS
jgi:hypothetical protein